MVIKASKYSMKLILNDVIIKSEASKRCGETVNKLDGYLLYEGSPVTALSGFEISPKKWANGKGQFRRFMLSHYTAQLYNSKTKKAEWVEVPGVKTCINVSEGERTYDDGNTVKWERYSTAYTLIDGGDDVDTKILQGFDRH
jgi:hypothetical protein